MNTQLILNKTLNILQLLLKINFNASVIFVLIVSVLSIAGSEIFFENNTALYGPLANNLRIVLLYICMMQLAVYGFYQMSNNYVGVFILGGFLLITIVALRFYAMINQIEVDESYHQVFLYAGLSHLLYGGLCFWRKNDGN